MKRDNLDDLPDFGLPEGYSIEWYKPDYEKFWLNIQEEADTYNSFDTKTFVKEFGDDKDLLHERQCYVLNRERAAIGTSTAWFDHQYMGEEFGRVHWVAIVPLAQGLGLGKPLLSATCQRLKKLGHSRAYLTTSTVRVPAINLYLLFGFRPNIQNEQDTQRWEMIKSYLKYDY